MGEIVNLRQRRKTRVRQVAASKAAQNRAQFGRSKLERTAAEADLERDRRKLDGHLREDSPPSGEMP